MILVQNDEFHGLKLVGPIDLGTDIAIVIGRNGAGKTRLLQAIVDGKIAVSRRGILVAPNLIKLNQLQPNLIFGFDPLVHRDSQAQAKLFYRGASEKFCDNPQDTISALSQPGLNMGRRGVNIGALAHAASRASQVTGKPVTELNEQDIADFYSASSIAQLGALSVTAIIREYMQRQRDNEFNSYMNDKHGTSHPYYLPAEFATRYGPPPWEVFNEFLALVLDHRYKIRNPLDHEFDTYEAALYRSDGKSIDPSLLSSGEKALLWLSLSMYNVNANNIDSKPSLLLFDEPDSTLHPQMIQKLHLAIRMLAEKFQCDVLFTSHSPTTVALSEQENIFQISETSIVPIEKDAAIAELLYGVDRISIQYRNNRQIYVESHIDARIYFKIYSMLRLWDELPISHVSLSFIPAAPKLSTKLVKDIHLAIFPQAEAGKLDEFVLAINGQGNCEQVIGAVETLVMEGNITISGIIDWDLKNQEVNNIHVLGEHVFYNIENAILNPITLGIYLLNFFPERVNLSDFGISDNIDLVSLYNATDQWQTLADAVTKSVLGGAEVSYDVEVIFLNGAKIFFDKRYVHMNGHDLEGLVRRKFSFLNAFRSQNPLTVDVVTRGMQVGHGRTMPAVFRTLLGNIQAT